MLTDAIGFIQNIQLVCFAIVFGIMAAKDRRNSSLRWLAFTYAAGSVGGVFFLANGFLPVWMVLTFGSLAAPVGYACLHMGIVRFVGWGKQTWRISVLIVLICLAAFLMWSLPEFHRYAGGLAFPFADRISTLADLGLAIQTALTSWLLLGTCEEETVWPRRVMGGFLCFYSAVEALRVLVFVMTGQQPGKMNAQVEVASGIVYVVSCSVLPLAFIWMMHARLHAHMSRQMVTDPLTQLLNRRGLQAAGELEVARYVRGRQEFAVVLIDIDHFKRLNDKFGHAVGDGVLREAASLFRAMVRDSDVVGRIGGEEFVLLLPATPPGGAEILVERLRAAMEGYSFRVGDELANVTASFGITVSGDRRDLNWAGILNEADEALYAAKREGRNLARMYEVERVPEPEVSLATVEGLSEICLGGDGGEGIVAGFEGLEVA